MADPFYSNKRNPFHHVYYPRAQIQPRSTRPKLVNIPVHFVGGASKQSPAPATLSTVPKRDSRAAAAIAIQKSVRGFLVRKNVSLVRQVESEADAIERKVREEDDKVRVDPRERIRVSEGLMALLLRLDSVRGVRDYRKKVIGRVIRLQEEVDSISDASNCNIPVTDDVADRESPAAGEAHKESSSIVHDPTQQTEKCETEMEIEIPAAVVSPNGTADLIMEADDAISKNRITEGQGESKSGAEESSLELEVEMDEEIETGLEKETRTAVESPPKRKSDMIGIGNGEDGTGPTEEENSKDDNEEKRGLRRMMERIAVENESLKRMVAQLCETSAEQCRLMEGLADRVSHLERLSHRKDRRKKRRNGSSCSALSSGK